MRVGVLGGAVQTCLVDGKIRMGLEMVQVCMRLVGLRQVQSIVWVIVKVHPFGTIQCCKEEFYELDFTGFMTFMSRIITQSRGDQWRWRRKHIFLLGGGFVCAVIYFLDNIILQYSVTDSWFWKLDLAYGYLVKGVYKWLPSDDQQAQAPIIDILWNKAMPLKVSLFAWRLINKSLPTITWFGVESSNLACYCAQVFGLLCFALDVNIYCAFLRNRHACFLVWWCPSFHEGHAYLFSNNMDGLYLDSLKGA